MKSIFTIILLAGIVYLSSCSNKDAKTSNLVAIPSADSVTKGSVFKIYFNNDTFVLNDLVVQNVPVEGLYASTSFNLNDSFWTGQIQVNDYLLKQIGLNLNVVDTTDPYSTSTGNYYVTDNSSTLTDYSTGENKTYTITLGSYVNITRSYSPVTGTFFLNLYYNHTTIPATGSFLIYK